MNIPPVSAIADVLGLWGLDGWLTPPLQSVVGAAAPVVGRVLTIRIEAAPSGPGFAGMYDVLSGNLTDRAVVISGAHAVPGAVWGEILATAAKQAGAAVTVLEGWARDVPALASIGLPLYASGLRVNGPNGVAQLTHIGGDVCVAGVSVNDGDFIVADEGGCVRVPQRHFEAIVDAANRYAEGETAVLAALAGGERLATAYRHKKSVVDELRRR